MVQRRGLAYEATYNENAVCLRLIGFFKKCFRYYENRWFVTWVITTVWCQETFVLGDDHTREEDMGRLYRRHEEVKKCIEYTTKYHSETLKERDHLGD